MFLEMVRHPLFDMREFSFENVVQLIRKVERPYAESELQTINLWQEWDGNQRLELVEHNCRPSVGRFCRNCGEQTTEHKVQ